jgi:tetratricopeptide (TPR) repeat protein
MENHERAKRRALWYCGGFTLVILLVVATAWNMARSAAIVEARRAYGRGELTVCLQHSLDHLQRQPWSQEAALLAAHCLSRLDYSEQAEPYYRRAGNLTINDLQIRAYGLVRGPHPERAIPVFNEILAGSPENVSAMRRLAALLLAQNEKEELLKLAERLENTAHGAVIGSFLRGVVYHNDKNRQQAVIAFSRVLELDPELEDMPLDHTLFWSHLADDLIGSGRIEEARSHLLKAVAKTPAPELLSRLGQTYFLQGSLDDAERWFREAAELAPADWVPHMNLAKVAIQRRNHEEALRQLSQARELAPRQYSVMYSLASVYRQLGRTDDANQIQDSLKKWRGRTTTTARNANGTWPRYAL